MAVIRSGVVTAIDRAADPDPVRAVLSDGTAITAAYFGQQRRRMIWPLCTAHFVENAGTWMCLGPVGDRRQLVHDDFTTAPAASASGTVFGDTPWTASLSGGSTLSASNPGDAQGVVALNAASAASACQIAKNPSRYVSAASPTGIWVKSRFRYTNTSHTIRLRLSATAAILSSLQFILVAGTPTVQLVTGDNTATTITQVAGTTVIADAWYWFEMILTDSFVAAWVNGDGPYVNEGDFSSNLWTLNVVALGTGAGTGTLYADLVEASLVSPMNDPTLYALN